MGQEQSYQPTPPPNRSFKNNRRRELLVKRIAQKMISTHGTPYPQRHILAQEPALSRPGDVEFYYDFIQRVYNPQTGQFREDLNQRLHYGGNQPVGQPQVPYQGNYQQQQVGQPQTIQQPQFYPQSQQMNQPQGYNPYGGNQHYATPQNGPLVAPTPFDH